MRLALKAIILAVIFSTLFLIPAYAVEEKKSDPSQALQNYVAKPDASFSYEVRYRSASLSASYVAITFTSQTWKEIPWYHRLYIVMPDSVRMDKKNHNALLVIEGGSWKDRFTLSGEPTSEEVKSFSKDLVLAATLANTMQVPVVFLKNVPMQPIFDGRKEDAIIAYTLDKYMKTGDPEWPLLLPMVKSAVRAMDVAQQLAKDEWGFNIDSFIVTGASKRGWTTWLTAMVDNRVTAIAPIVIDVLNMDAQMKHQADVWGRQSEQIEEYTDLGLEKAFKTERGQDMLRIIDPYRYINTPRLQTIPKLIILGANDPYWTVDALNLYWEDLPGPKYILYIPNVGHKGSSAVGGLAKPTGGVRALVASVSGRLSLPKLTWEFSESKESLKIVVTSDKKPKKVLAWVNTSPDDDFREHQWVPEGLSRKEGAYLFELPVPTDHCAVVFIELGYGSNEMPYSFTTNTYVVGPPDLCAAVHPDDAEKGLESVPNEHGLSHP